MTMQLAFEAVSHDAVQLSVRERRHRVGDPHVDGVSRTSVRPALHGHRLDDVMTGVLMLGVTLVGALMSVAVLAVAPVPAAPAAVVLAVTTTPIHR